MWCRSLGIPHDVVDATEHLLRIADDFRPFPVHVDGDYLGDFEEIEYGVAPGGLLAVA